MSRVFAFRFRAWSRISQALGVSTLELLGLAFQWLELEMEESMVRIDLRKIIDDERDKLRPLRRWLATT
jgi:hypothetical protein